ncbi:Ig-like domain-containing protein [Paenibacillus amylolyticus]|uniref:Ig-like domain-containing protein n=1 Tax=Paenibacillus amylolyticus TaxID=1451 RepID=UPI0032426F0F
MKFIGVTIAAIITEMTWKICMMYKPSLNLFREGLLAHDMVRTDIEGAVEANVIEVEGDFGRNLLLRRSPLMNEAIEVPETAVIKTIDDIHAVTATAIYTDGSKAVKQVKWNTDDINFHQSGSYEITGTVIQQFYPFSVAVGRADPHILRWQDKYYFIATNDDNDNIGLYVREADIIQGLFAPDIIEHVVLIPEGIPRPSGHPSFMS